MRFLFPLIFVAVPIVEIGLFVQVGSLVGLWRTLAMVAVTAVIGAGLLRRQGFAILAQGRETLERAEFPLEPVVHGVFLLVAGLLLLTPGFFTDAIGFALLVPRLRLALARGVWSRLENHVRVVGPGMTRPSSRPRDDADGHPVIDGDVVEEETTDDPPHPADPNSPWKR